MERQPVNSSNIAAVGYDSESQILEVEFNDSVYQYFDVPEYVHQEFMESHSLGSYHHHNIRGQFSYERV